MLLTCQHDFFSPCMFLPLPSSKSEIVKRSQNRADASACYLGAKQTFLCNLSCLGCFIIAMNNRWITFCLMALLLLLLFFGDRVSFCRSDWPEIYQLSLRASALVCLWDYRLEPPCLTIGFPYCWHWRTRSMFWVVVHFFFWFCKADPHYVARDGLEFSMQIKLNLHLSSCLCMLHTMITGIYQACLANLSNSSLF